MAQPTQTQTHGPVPGSLLAIAPHLTAATVNNLPNQVTFTHWRDTVVPPGAQQSMISVEAPPANTDGPEASLHLNRAKVLAAIRAFKTHGMGRDGNDRLDSPGMHPTMYWKNHTQRRAVAGAWIEPVFDGVSTLNLSPYPFTNSTPF